MRKYLFVILLTALLTLTTTAISYSNIEMFNYNDSSLTILESGFHATYGSDSSSTVRPQINNNGDVVWGTRSPQINDNGSIVRVSEVDVNLYDDVYASQLHVSLFDGSNTAVLSYTGLPENCYINLNPQINDNGNVVWVSSCSSGNGVYLYDGYTSTKLPNNGSNPSYGDTFPQINDNSEVVWSDYNGIFFYDGSTISQISFLGTDLLINNNSEIVWSDGGNGIFLYDGLTTSQLFSDYTYAYHINDNSDVFWVSSDGLYLYDGSTTTLLTNSVNCTDRFDSCAINDMGYVAWAEYYYVSTVYGDGLRSDVYLYDGLTTRKISNNNYYSHSLDINTNGDVVWANAVVPEPISSTLFIIGGATLGFRRFRKKITS